MKTILKGKIYNTDKSELIAETKPFVFSDFEGPLGAHVLRYYKTKNGNYFKTRQIYKDRSEGLFHRAMVPTNTPIGEERIISLNIVQIYKDLVDLGFLNKAKEIEKEHFIEG